MLRKLLFVSVLATGCSFDGSDPDYIGTVGPGPCVGANCTPAPSCDCATGENCNEEELLVCGVDCGCDGGDVCIDDECVPMGCFDGAGSALVVTVSSNEEREDYQVRVELDAELLFNEGGLEESCTNLRFVDTDGVALPYWLEGPCLDGVFWIKLGEISQGDNVIYALIGANTISGSDGVATFAFFDDFSTPNDWTVSRIDDQPGLEDSQASFAIGQVVLRTADSCNVGPRDGDEIRISRTVPGRDSGRYCMETAGVIRVDVTPEALIADGFEAIGSVSIDAVRGDSTASFDQSLACNLGQECPAEADIVLPRTGVPRGEFALTLAGRSEECTSSRATIETLRVRRCVAEADEPQASVNPAVITCAPPLSSGV